MASSGHKNYGRKSMNINELGYNSNTVDVLNRTSGSLERDKSWMKDRSPSKEKYVKKYER
jgi:hypothetical protein